MTKALDLDLEKLKDRAFDRADWAAHVLRRYHDPTLKLSDVVAQQLRGLYQWMFVPPTLWPFNVQDVLEDCLTAQEKGKRLNARHRLLLDFLPAPPEAFLQTLLERAANGHRFAHAFHLRGERGIGLRNGGRAPAPRRRSAVSW